MGLLGTAAKVAVASHVHGKVQRRQSQRWAAQDAAAAAAQVPTQPGPPLPSVSAPAPDDMMARLAQLGELRASGVLTEPEFQAAKARILGT